MFETSEQLAMHLRDPLDHFTFAEITEQLKSYLDTILNAKTTSHMGAWPMSFFASIARDVGTLTDVLGVFRPGRESLDARLQEPEMLDEIETVKNVKLLKANMDALCNSLSRAAALSLDVKGEIPDRRLILTQIMLDLDKNTENLCETFAVLDTFF